MQAVSRSDVIRLWLHRQGLARPRGESALTRSRFVQLLETTGGLQVDSINVVDRAHLLTLWSRFGSFDRASLNRWMYSDRVAYEYWGHEASILPGTHLPLGRRRMRSFPPPRWESKSWWSRFQTSAASRRRVLKRIREEGPLESISFEAEGSDREDKRSLKLLWHSGQLAVSRRKHFRLLYDLAERVYPEGRAARQAEYEESWLLIGLSGNGVANERHLAGYWTAPELYADTRRAVIDRCLRRGSVVRVRVEGMRGSFLARPEDLAELPDLEEPTGTTLLSPFDSLLWQRKRAEELLDFHYRVEIYVPEAKREFGYYAMPILHEGRLVGRVDPKLHRDRGLLEIRSLRLEQGFRPDADFRRELRAAVEDLGSFVGATDVRIPSYGK